MGFVVVCLAVRIQALFHLARLKQPLPHEPDVVASPRDWQAALRRALNRPGRRECVRREGAFRAFSGGVDGVEGVFVDCYGSGAVLAVYHGTAPGVFVSREYAQATLEALRPAGVRAVYVKPFARDRSRLGGALPPETFEATPLAGEPLPEALHVSEHAYRLEVRLYDGLSTGLFLDQRENRRWVLEYARRFAADRPANVLNTFAYTCAFSVAAAMGGAITTSVDVSARYIEWGRRNFTLNGLDASLHRWARMDTFEFFQYARRKQLRYDLVILDPPSFGAGNKRRGIRPWSAVDGYATLVREAAELLSPGGIVFASTNTGELCQPGRLRREVVRGLKREPTWLHLPPPPPDFASERGRFAAVAFSPERSRAVAPMRSAQRSLPRPRRQLARG